MTHTDLALREPTDVDAALPVEPTKAAQILLYLIAGLISLGFVWAATAKLDRVTRGEGRIVPSSQLQEVQYLEGGIVKEIFVRAGDRVREGDVLIQLDSTQVNADYLQGRDGYNLLAARIIRLETEARGLELSFPEDLLSSAPEIVADETALYAARRAEYESAHSVQKAEHDDALAALALAERSAALAGEETRMIAPLVEKGIEPRIELVRARQRLASAEGELARARIAVERADSQLRNTEQTFTARAGDELTQAKARMADYAGELPALRDKIDRTDLRAPIDGVVNRVLVTTVGGVVRPGETVVELVPAGDTPLVKARIKPADIGFLREGQNARVKLTAYDASVYGSLDAVIETIGADAVEDPQTRESYFEIWVRTDETALMTKDGPLQIMPGMAAEVDVLNGKRSVLAYLFKPLAEVKNQAFREQ